MDFNPWADQIRFSLDWKSDNIKWPIEYKFNELRKFERLDFTTNIQFRIADYDYGDQVANNVFVE